MDVSLLLRTVITQQTMTTLFGVVALGLGLVLSLNQGNLIVTGFMLVFTTLVVLVLASQVRTAVREATYT